MPPAPALPNSFDQPAILTVEVPQTGAHNDAAKREETDTGNDIAERHNRFPYSLA